MNEYATLTKQENGDLRVTITQAGRRRVAELLRHNEATFTKGE